MNVNVYSYSEADAPPGGLWSQIGMLFVRCRGGVSHSPEESVTDDDVWAAGLALANFVEQAAVSSEPQPLEAAERSAVAAS